MVLEQSGNHNIPGLCPICESGRYFVRFSDVNRRDGLSCGGTYVECGNCSHIYLLNKPDWAEIVGFYSSQDLKHKTNAGLVRANKSGSRTIPGGSILPKWVQKLRFRAHSLPVEGARHKGARLLDCGCGNGAKLVEFASRGYEVWGIDISPSSIAACKKVLPEGNFFVRDLSDTKFPDEHFDFVRMDNALEHVPDALKVVSEAFRVLKKGGKLFIYVPHGKSFSMRVLKGGSISSWIPFHLHLFTFKSMTEAVQKAGCSNFKIYGFYPLSSLPLSVYQCFGPLPRFLQGPSGSMLINLLLYPAGWILSKIGFPEELVCVAVK